MEEKKKSTKQASKKPVRTDAGGAKPLAAGQRLFPPNTAFYFTPRQLSGLFAMFARFELLEEALEILERNGVEFRMSSGRRVGEGSDLHVEVEPTAVRDSTRDLQDLLRRHPQAPRHDDVQRFLESGVGPKGVPEGCPFLKFQIVGPGPLPRRPY